jgi:four helix bundle protein
VGNSFEDLQVWKRSCRLAVDLIKILKGNKDFYLKNQMLDAVISIPSNIAEGSERGTKPEFKRFLRIAKGSAAELRTQMYIAQKVEVIDVDVSKKAIEEVKEISCMLQGLIDSL